MTGRRQKFTTEQIENALRNAGGSRSGAARQLHCSLTCVSNYIRRSPELQRVEAEIVEETIDFAEAQLLKNIKDGKEPSLIFFLKTKAKHRGYVEKVEVGGRVDHSHAHTHRSAAVDFDSMTKAELDAYRAERSAGPKVH
jgi:hypothetical protein